MLTHRYTDGSERPIKYASRTLLPIEQNYAQLEKEALAITFAVKKFHMYLYGCKFILVTDHQPLWKIFGSKEAIPTLAAAQLQRWAVVLSAYVYDIEWRASTANATADMLSRLPLAATSADSISPNNSMIHLIGALPVTAASIRQATARDTVLSQVLEFT